MLGQATGPSLHWGQRQFFRVTHEDKGHLLFPI